MLDIRLNIDGKELIVSVQLQDRRTSQARVERLDDRDGWPSSQRASKAKLQSRTSAVPAKKWTKRPGKVTDPQRVFANCGPGSDSNKGMRAYAGLQRAIYAEGEGPDNGTGCIVASAEVL